jgi:hypothetical protein
MNSLARIPTLKQAIPSSIRSARLVHHGGTFGFDGEETMQRKEFYDTVRTRLGALSQDAVDGFELVLDEAEKRKTATNDLAYILATAWWETARTMQPVREAFFISSDFNKAEAWRKKTLNISRTMEEDMCN